MVQVLHTDPAPPVIVEGDVLFITELEVRDPDVVAVVVESDDPVAAVHQLLRFGAQVQTVAQASIDAALIDRRFEELTRKFDGNVSSAVGDIVAAATALADGETGALTLMLAKLQRDLAALLDATFDPDSKVSALAKLDAILADARDQQVQAVRRLINPDSEDSPLALLKSDIVTAVKTGIIDIQRDVREVSERLAVKQAVEPVLDKTTGKGFDFEETFDHVLTRIAAPHGDVAERVGTVKGVVGTQAGDELVTINHEDTQGLPGRFVFELKARSMNMRKTLEELDKAMVNREALAGIAVFTTAQEAPTTVPFHYADNRAVVVLDCTGLDDAAVRLAYMWARWVVRRQIATISGEEIDFARVDALMDDARRALERASAVKRCHTTAKKSIDQAADQVDCLVTEVETALDALGAEVSPG